jgi:hypothetical protein
MIASNVPQDMRQEAQVPTPRRGHPDPDLDPIEPPMHRPRSCPACTRESRDIRVGRCRVCRSGVR